MGQNTSPTLVNNNKPPQSAIASLKFNGLYIARREQSLFYILRFYEDGVVISDTVSSPPLQREEDLKKIAKWFNKDHEGTSKGTYKVEENTITFSTTVNYTEPSEARTVIIDYSGTIENGGSTLALKFYSHYTAHRAKEKYEFVEMEVSTP